MIILVVDDSQTVRRRVRKEFEAANCCVHEASSGEQALEMLQEIRPDVITLDVDMPGLSGFETCYRIRKGKGEFAKVHPDSVHVPIIFLTANDTKSARHQGFQAGANGFVVKPFLPGELTEEVDRALMSYDDLRGHSVLIVDDSQTMRSNLRRGLSSKGLTVIEASDGKEALDILRRRRDTIDLVITDYIMPEMDGIAFCAAARSELGLRELPILFLTTANEKEFMLKIFEAGASDYLVKPFMPEELQARVVVHLKSKLLGDTLRDKVLQLKRAHKLKDQFLSICSHDLRAPLTGIQGFTDLLLDEEDLTDLHREFLGHIRSSSDFLRSIIEDILDLGRLQSETATPEFIRIDLAAVLDSCIKTLSHMASPKGISVELLNGFKPNEPAIVSADLNGIKRLINNLVSNSIKFSHPKQTVSVVIRPQADNRVQIQVIDRGIGIPADKLAQLFEAGAKTSQRGTSGERSFGLGMSIVKQLVDQHDGSIDVESVEGQGTIVSVSLPQDRS